MTKVKFACYLFVGAPKWHGTERFEPSECPAEGVAEVPTEEWEEGIASVECPRCGGHLSQRDDHLERIVSEVAQ